MEENSPRLQVAPRPGVVLRRTLVGAATLFSVAALSLQLGFEATASRLIWIRLLSVGAAVLLLADFLLAFVESRRRGMFLRRRLPVLLLLSALILAYVLERNGASTPLRWLDQLPLVGVLGAYVIGLQLWVLIALLVEASRLNRALARWRVRPGRLVALLFALLVVLGTLLLRLPRAAAEGVDLSWLDALFTATSAVCVTGLTVIDPSEALSPTGQGILLGLIQIGGLGIMAFTGFLAVTIGPGLGIRERSVFADLLQADVVAHVGRTLRRLVLWTLSIEAVGTLLLIGPMGGLSQDRTVFHAVFHSVSAFCNAGFSTFESNLAGATTMVGANAVVALLVASGSVGVPTMLITADWLRSRRAGRRAPLPSGVKVVWLASVILWVVGAILLLALDRSVLPELPWPTRVLAALFQSVSARTAGFNTVEIGAMSSAALLLLMLLMFIGGAPGGTAGGIKVTTFSVLLAAVRSMVRGDREVLLFGRGVDEQNLREALSLALIAGMAVIVGLGALLWIEGGSFVDLAFETVSALCTTGLSTGVTGELSAASRWVVIVLMFVGRVGPLTVALAVVAPRSHRVRHPRQRIPVG